MPRGSGRFTRKTGLTRHQIALFQRHNMTNILKAGRTPANVADIATHSGAFDRQSTRLLGIFGTKANMSALFRTPTGKVVQVSNGTQLMAGRVIGIDETGVMLLVNGKVQRFTMPEDKVVN